MAAGACVRDHECSFNVAGAARAQELCDYRILGEGVHSHHTVDLELSVGSGSTRAHGVIEVDHVRMAERLLDTLAEDGASRIACLVPDMQFHSSWAADVDDAYQSWCARHSVEPLITRLTVTPTDRELRDAVLALVEDESVDALVCAPQGLAGRSLPILESIGRTVGTHFRLASLAGEPATELQNPHIISLDLVPHQFGREAIELLLDICQGRVPADTYRSHRARLVQT